MDSADSELVETLVEVEGDGDFFGHGFMWWWGVFKDCGGGRGQMWVGGGADGGRAVYMMGRKRRWCCSNMARSPISDGQPALGSMTETQHQGWNVIVDG